MIILKEDPVWPLGVPREERYPTFPSMRYNAAAIVSSKGYERSSGGSPGCGNASCVLKVG